jgi:[ribosomal protein S5]-alanine N-acetyltransferase
MLVRQAGHSTVWLLAIGHPYRYAPPMSAPHHIDTARLVLTRPDANEADVIFARYAGDPDVTRFVGWPAHRTTLDTRAFLTFSDTEWHRSSVGPYLIRSRDDGRLLGSTGLGLETPFRASTGYVLARDAWGHGYATEALRAMIALSRQLRIVRLYALCHPDHRASWRVLEKCGFMREGTLRRYAEFPNLASGVPADVLCYADGVSATASSSVVAAPT